MTIPERLCDAALQDINEVPRDQQSRQYNFRMFVAIRAAAKACALEH
jgi:hypothetical protein